MGTRSKCHKWDFHLWAQSILTEFMITSTIEKNYLSLNKKCILNDTESITSSSVRTYGSEGLRYNDNMLY